MPANADVVDVSLRLLDRIMERSTITRLAGDLLCTNLKADRWAVPWPSAASSRSSRCARTPVAWSTSTVRSCSTAGCTAPMDQRPMPAKFAREEDEAYYDAVDEFRDSGLRP